MKQPKSSPRKGVRMGQRNRPSQSDMDGWLRSGNLLTEKEVSILLGISPAQLTSLGLAYFDVGTGTRRYDPRTIESYLQSGTASDNDAIGKYLQSLDHAGPVSSTRLSNILRLSPKQTYTLFETVPTSGMRWVNIGRLLAGRITKASEVSDE